MKVLNVFGIILAWIVSIALIVMLIVTPMLLSALSLLKPETITNALTSSITGGNQGPSSSAKEDGFVPVSAGTEGAQLTLLSTGSDMAVADAQGDLDLSLVDPDMVKDLLGIEVDEKALEKVLTSNVVNELVGTYTEDLANVIAGNGESKFNSETIKEIVNDNMDEIVDVLQQVSPELAETPKEELKSQIQTAVDKGADAIVEALPKPEEIKENLVSESPEAEMLFTILAKKNEIKMAIIGVVVVLSALIFFLRFPGFRGLRWLAVDLFVAGGINGILCAGLKVAGPMIMTTMEAEGETMATALVGSILSAFTNGMIWRTAVMLGSGVVLLMGYILIKKFRNKAAVAEESAEEPVALEEPAAAEETETV